MNEQEKSLKLAELMGWEIETYYGDAPYICASHFDNKIKHIPLVPYEMSQIGLAQFAAIFFKFREVMCNECFLSYEAHKGLSYCEPLEKEPTQANILDEILRMNGVKI